MIHLLVISLFLAVLVRDSMDRPIAPLESPFVSALALAVPLAGIWAVATVLLARCGRALDRTGDYRALGWTDRVLIGSKLLITAWFWWCVLGFGWLDAVRDGIGDLVLIDELAAVLAPLVTMSMLWWSQYPIDRRLREAALIANLDRGRPIYPPPSRWGFMLLAIRHQILIILVPIALIMAWSEGVAFATEARWWPAGAPGQVLPAALQLIGAAGVFCFMPPVMRMLWDTQRLGAGELRERLLALCRAHGVRIRELLLWKTHGTMVNGAVMGLAGPLRYILLTDALLDSLTRQQVEAVMAHEVAHVRRRHILWLAAALLGAVFASAALGELLVRWVADGGEAMRHLAVQMTTKPDPLDGTLGAVITAASVALGLLTFGFVSRRFEWQADAFAVKHLSGAHAAPDAVITEEAALAMRSALGRVAALNHIPPQRFSWRHGSIASRQHRIGTLVGRRADRLPIDRRVRLIKIITALAIVGVATLIAWDLRVR